MWGGAVGCVPSFQWGGGWWEIRAVPGTLGSACSPSSGVGLSQCPACESWGDGTLHPPRLRLCLLAAPPFPDWLLLESALGSKKKVWEAEDCFQEEMGEPRMVPYLRGPHRVLTVFTPGVSAGGLAI